MSKYFHHSILCVLLNVSRTLTHMQTIFWDILLGNEPIFPLIFIFLDAELFFKWPVSNFIFTYILTETSKCIFSHTHILYHWKTYSPVIISIPSTFSQTFMQDFFHVATIFLTCDIFFYCFYFCLHFVIIHCVIFFFLLFIKSNVVCTNIGFWKGVIVVIRFIFT